MTTSAFQVGDCSVLPGERASGSFFIGNRGDGTPLGVPFIVVRGESDGPVFCMDAGIHGDEPEGSLAILEIMKRLDPAQLRGTVVGVPLLNLPAGELGQRTTSPSYETMGHDMNRIMPGRAHEGTTMRVAAAYWNGIAARSNCVISIHGGGMQQFMTTRIIYQREIPASLELAKSMGGDWTILQGNIPDAGSTEKACSALNIPCLILELGGSAGRMPAKLLGMVDEMVTGITNVMRHLEMVDGAISNVAKEWTIIQGGHTVWTQNGGLATPLPALELRARVAPGTPLFEVYTLHGKLAETVTAPWDGLILGFKSTIYHRPGDIVCSVGKVLEVIR